MNELENVMTFSEKMHQINNAVQIVKCYKKAMRDLLAWIQKNYSRDFFFSEYFKSDTITRALVVLNLSLKFRIGSSRITVVNNSDSTLKMSIKLLEGDAYQKNWSKGDIKNANIEKRTNAGKQGHRTLRSFKF